MISIKTKNRLFYNVLPLLCVLPLLSAMWNVFPLASHFYHIRSLRERGHRLPYCFRLLLLPYRFRKYSCRLVGLFAAVACAAACTAAAAVARARAA
ncbi:hypothetical protein MmiAt1_14950 [Methanimicrococcus sp. At1]|uniref:Secreted peptide n=2 Tax=Methanimicrococcus hacksteinii TaxID=3028293 RepID=A0ABU3VR55_9EURY|nr:hypothetical protein [Methanimicrococcus sp. At1]